MLNNPVNITNDNEKDNYLLFFWYFYLNLMLYSFYQYYWIFKKINKKNIYISNG